MAPKQKKSETESPAGESSGNNPIKGPKSAIVKQKAPPKQKTSASAPSANEQTKIVRHRGTAVMSEEDYGVENPSIHRMARLGGVLRLSHQVVERMKRIMDARMLHLLRTSSVFMGSRKTLQLEDVRSALMERDTGFN